MIKGGSKSFFAASMLLPRSLRDDAYALYAFCRLSDDMVDVEAGAAGAIARLTARLDQAYRGNPADGAVDRAFAAMVAHHDLPRALPEALLEGLAWDVDGVACETLEDCLAYAARVAGSVGAMMTVLMGVRDSDVLARACDLGVAMQLTNIARDVGEDARNGRLYLPRAWLAAEGVDADAFLANPVFSPQLGRVVARLLDVADTLYARAEGGIAGLPAGCRPAIFAARHLYAAIGDEVARHGFDSIMRRAHVAKPRKLALMARALSDAVTVRRMHEHPALEETRFLVDAAAQAQPLRARGVSGKILWVAELFVALEQRRQCPL